MYKSILQFCQEGSIKLENLSASFFERPKDIAGFVAGVRDNVINLGCAFMGEVFEELDKAIKESPERKRKYDVVKIDEKEMLTSLGSIRYKKTLYRNKRTREYVYLLDEYLGFEEGDRMTEDAEAEVLLEAVQTSYRRGGEAASITDKVSKTTVKNKIHKLEFPGLEPPREKKKVKYLYIDADEDHVPMQFFKNKGDTKEKGNEKKRNRVQVKLAYVYEGIEPEAPTSKRYKLKNPHYFSGIYEGEENSKLWDEIYEYMDSHYELEHVEKVYLNADGGSWITEGKRKIQGIISVLDEYHINKYLTQMTTHLYDSKDDGKDLLREAIKNGTKEDFKEVVQKIKEHAESEKEEERIRVGEKYILSNWTSSKIRLNKKKGIIGSSTEGHVSHVLATRMSSRPMGWSKRGADQMGRLRAYYWNKGDMLELVRYQKKELKKVAGSEEISLTIAEITAWENAHRSSSGIYVDKIQHSIPAQTRKIFAIRERMNVIR